MKICRQGFIPAPFILLCLLVALAAPPNGRASATPTPEALAQLAAQVQAYLEDGQIVGAELLVLKDREPVLHEVFGWRDREAGIAVGVRVEP